MCVFFLCLSVDTVEILVYVSFFCNCVCVCRCFSLCACVTVSFWGLRSHICGACRPWWSMSVVLELCLEEVKLQMMMRVDEIGENYENLMAKVVCGSV